MTAADWFAHWFDEDYSLVYAHRDETEAEQAIALALGVAPGLAHGPVLDLGCGGARHLAVMRRTNPRAFGLDLSAHLLGTAPESLRPWLLRGDMRHLPVRPGSLAGVTLWFTPFGYFSDVQNQAVLQGIARCLAPGGVLVLDFLNAGRLRRDLEPESVLEREGLRVTIQRRIEAGRVVKRMELLRLDSGAVRSVTESVRLYEPWELTGMAARAGLRLVAERGDYAGDGFQATASPRWIGFLEKPTREARPARG